MQKLLYTTHTDLSLPQFADWKVMFYDEPSPAQAGDLVYFRDPFNDPDYRPDAQAIDQLIRQYPASKIVDHITSYQDMRDLEDKFLQAKRYGELYPRSWLPSEHPFIPGKTLAKPRISQRAKDILFALDGRVLNDSWLIQELLDIQEELRVYAVNGQVIDQVSVKSSKIHGPVKVIGTREISPAERRFVEQALEHCPLDVVGFDIAVLPEGKFKIIEANRSPQFKRFYERTGINLADAIDDIN